MRNNLIKLLVLLLVSLVFTTAALGESAVEAAEEVAEAAPEVAEEAGEPVPREEVFGEQDASGLPLELVERMGGFPDSVQGFEGMVDFEAIAAIKAAWEPHIADTIDSLLRDGTAEVSIPGAEWLRADIDAMHMENGDMLAENTPLAVENAGDRTVLSLDQQVPQDQETMGYALYLRTGNNGGRGYNITGYHILSGEYQGVWSEAVYFQFLEDSAHFSNILFRFFDYSNPGYGYEVIVTADSALGQSNWTAIYNQEGVLDNVEYHGP